MSAGYDRSYLPPAPVLSVRFGRSGERLQIGPLLAVVDTGADATILPETIPQQLKAPPLNPGQLESQWGDVHLVTLYLVDIEVEGQLLPGIVVAGDSASHEIVLGRDVLNRLPLFLDGPQQHSDVLDEGAANRLRDRRKQA